MNKAIYFETDPYFWRVFSQNMEETWLSVEIVSTLSDYREIILKVLTDSSDISSLKFVFWDIGKYDFDMLLDEIFINYMQIFRYLTQKISFTFFETLDSRYLDGLDYLMDQRIWLDVANLSKSYGKELWFHDFSSRVDLIIEWNFHSVSIQTLDPQLNLESLRI